MKQHMTEAQAKRHQWKRGDIVLYTPDQVHAFGAVVECDPWTLGGGHAVMNLRGLGDSYRACVGGVRSRVNAAFAGALRPAPTEYVEGEWCCPTHDSEPAAVVTYSENPSPETGHVGWCWWALGRMGESPSYEDAKEEAERVVRAVGRLADG